MAPTSGVSPVAAAIDRIGFGDYHWRLFWLCGLGWVADNMWLQGAVATLPKYQREFALSDAIVGLGNTCMFVGLSIGAAAWGAISDIAGRRPAFFSTLALTGFAGAAAALAPNFTTLCIAFALLSLGVGGSLPIDGALFLEFSPSGYERLLVLMSAFWPIGQLLVGLIAWAVAIADNAGFLNPIHAFAGSSESSWRVILAILAVITLVMAAIRVFYMRIIESPRFLAATGNTPGAIAALADLAKFNGVGIDLELLFTSSPSSNDSRSSHDSQDSHSSFNSPISPTSAHPLVLERSDMLAHKPSHSNSDKHPLVFLSKQPNAARPSQSNSDTRDASIESASTQTHTHDRHQQIQLATSDSSERLVHNHSSRSPKHAESGLTISTPLDTAPTKAGALLRQLKRLFRKDTWHITILVWSIWSLVSLGYVMFNMFLTKYLKEYSQSGTEPRSDIDTYKRYAILSLCGVPGSVVAAFTVSTRLGRLIIMAIATLGTSATLALFVMFTSDTSQLIIGCIESLLQNVMYGMLYTYTPEVFSAESRGTAVGIASALSRVAAMTAPVIGGALLRVQPGSMVAPVLASSFVLLSAFVCMVVLIFITMRKG